MVKRIKRYIATVGLRGLWWAALSKALGFSICLRFKKKQCKYPFWLRVHSSDVSVCHQVFISQEYDFHAEVKPHVILDAGANIGLASIYFANRYPDAKIIAVEPEESNFILLKRNASFYPNIVPLKAALWDKNEEIDLVDPGRGKWGFITAKTDSISEALSNNACRRVSGVTVDKIMSDFGLKKIDIMKVDIEGAEREVFHDPSSWIGQIDAIVIELHERFKTGCRASVFTSTKAFQNVWRQGENLCLSRGAAILRHHSE